jgi:hypothetical protein
MSTDRSRRWDWYAHVKLYEIRKKWPQLLNWEQGKALYCNNNIEDRKQFDVLRYITLGDGNETLRPFEFIPLIVKFHVADWPKPKEVSEIIRWKDLTSDQKQRYTYLAYWLGLNNKPVSPRNHAPISGRIYEGVSGSRASIGVPSVAFQASNNPRGICKRWGKK